MKKVIIIGAGMAGSEAAWQVAERGIKVDLYEMRPKNPRQRTKQINLLNSFAVIHCAVRD